MICLACTGFRMCYINGLLSQTSSSEIFICFCWSRRCLSNEERCIKFCFKGSLHLNYSLPSFLRVMVYCPNYGWNLSPGNLSFLGSYILMVADNNICIILESYQSRHVFLISNWLEGPKNPLNYSITVNTFQFIPLECYEHGVMLFLH